MDIKEFAQRVLNLYETNEMNEAKVFLLKQACYDLRLTATGASQMLPILVKERIASSEEILRVALGYNREAIMELADNLGMNNEE